MNVYAYFFLRVIKDNKSDLSSTYLFNQHKIVALLFIYNEAGYLSQRNR